MEKLRFYNEKLLAHFMRLNFLCKVHNYYCMCFISYQEIKQDFLLFVLHYKEKCTKKRLFKIIQDNVTLGSISLNEAKYLVCLMQYFNYGYVQVYYAYKRFLEKQGENINVDEFLEVVIVLR